MVGFQSPSTGWLKAAEREPSLVQGARGGQRAAQEVTSAVPGTTSYAVARSDHEMILSLSVWVRLGAICIKEDAFTVKLRRKCAQTGTLKVRTDPTLLPGWHTCTCQRSLRSSSWWTKNSSNVKEAVRETAWKGREIWTKCGRQHRVPGRTPPKPPSVLYDSNLMHSCSCGDGSLRLQWLHFHCLLRIKKLNLIWSNLN